MCLLFISLKNHPNYKLLVAANRDEFYGRKTAPVHFWEDHPEILGGRDLEASGTWMAMTNDGKIGMVTNYRDPFNINPDAPSRGQLVSDFLLNGVKAHEYMESVAQKAKLYNGFNLITGTPDELFYYSNYKNSPEKITPGLHGLSNHLLNTPWPKVQRGISKMEGILQKKEIDPVDLFEALYDDQLASDDLLPNTGVGTDRERMLSSMFIKSPDYGSRSSTVVMVDHDNHVFYAERVYDLSSFSFITRTFEFSV
jgi:uncharacterized protein with NRDE domain